MKIKILFGSVAFVLSGILGVVLYAMTQMDILHLLLCSSNQGGTRIPSNVCEYYMINYRINNDDLKYLSDGPGLDAVLNVQSPKIYEFAELFISNGLDVNGVNNYTSPKITPLQAAVLFNDLERVKFLLKHGANIHIRNEHYKMTAIELAKKRHEETGKENRSEIIKLLSDAETYNQNRKLIKDRR